jgi:hypothetical protein
MGMRAFASVLVAGLLLASSALADDLWRVKPGETYSPGTYCNWNRTGLPLARQQVCNARDQQDAAGQSLASSTLLAFEANDAKAMRNVALANAAGQCGLRSGGWVETFNSAYAMASNTDIKRFGLSNAQVRTAAQAGQRVYANAMTTTKCRDLTNSPTMTRLDEIQHKLTGGYH